MSKRSLIVGISVLVVLCLSASSLVWGEKCKQVVVRHAHIGPILYGAENCEGFDGCATAEIQGTFKGTLLEAFYFDDAVNVFDDTWAFKNYGFLTTSQGELFLQEWSIADFSAPDGFAYHVNVLGGTGRYEGATGWLGAFDNFEGTFSTWGGEVCWPDEE